MADSNEVPKHSVDRHLIMQKNVYSRAEEVLAEYEDNQDGVGRTLVNMPTVDGRPCVSCQKVEGKISTEAIVGIRRESGNEISVFLVAPEGETLGRLRSATHTFGEPFDTENPKKYLGFKVTLSRDQVTQEIYGWPEGGGEDDWQRLDGLHSGEEGQEPDALDFASVCVNTLQDWKTEERSTEWALGTVAMAGHGQ